MCEKCDNKHQFGYHCSCECHQSIDRRIIERDSQNSGDKNNE